MLFIDVSAKFSQGAGDVQNETTQRHVRKHVMKDYRRRQRDGILLPDRMRKQKDDEHAHQSHDVRRPRVANPEVSHWDSSNTPPAKLAHALLAPAKPLLKSPGDQFRLHVVEWIQYAGLEGSWWTLLPSRVGQQACIDFSLAAIVSATQLIRGITFRQSPILALHGKAVQSLRTVLLHDSAASNDNALVAARLMGMLQMILRQAKAVHEEKMEWNADAEEVAHGQGTLALLTQRPGQSRESEIYRGILYADAAWNVFTLPLVNSEASPLEKADWSQVEPLLQVPQAHLATLQKASLRIYSALPGLIKKIRALGQDKTLESVRYHENIPRNLAALIFTSDKSAEMELIDQSILYPDNLSPVGFSIAFNSPDEYQAALAYWVTRILLFQLIESCVDEFPSWHTLFRSYKSTQIVQSARYFMSTTAYTMASRINHKPVACLGFEALWGILDDHGSQICTGWTPAQIRKWVQREYAAIPEIEFAVTDEYMDGWAKVYQAKASPSECF
ncbi:Hypothetical protein R9X50_00417100 [Acrodontium crateriforme]|uniref:Uncharacterized protein n=1 Tax=Acrodontium crateriforme TaxID=150365 RepID=A0AAQ3M7I2_9PEZI|nr:Hypothetical protein R9X50_00417100 [Acrodontium crateriforme]